MYSRGYILEENFLSLATHIKYSKIFENVVSKFLKSEEFLNNDKKQVRTALDFSSYDLKEFEEEMTDTIFNALKRVQKQQGKKKKK